MNCIKSTQYVEWLYRNERTLNDEPLQISTKKACRRFVFLRRFHYQNRVRYKCLCKYKTVERNKMDASHAPPSAITIVQIEIY